MNTTEHTTPSESVNASERRGHSARRRPGRWVHWLSALLIFCAGMVVGAGGTIGVIRQRIIEHHRKPPGHAVNHIMDRLDRKLDLREDQHARIEVIVQQRLGALREIRDETVPRVRAELGAALEDIATELDTAQEAAFRERFSLLEELLPPIPAAGSREAPAADSP